MILYLFYMESGIGESNVINYSFYIITCVFIYYLSYRFFNNWHYTKPQDVNYPPN